MLQYYIFFNTVTYYPLLPFVVRLRVRSRMHRINNRAWINDFCLFELLLQERCQVFRHLQRFHGHTNRGHTLGFVARDRVLGDTLLDGNVVGILGEKVWHGGGVLGLQLLHVHLVFVVGHVVPKDFLPGLVRDSGERIRSSASIGLDTDFFARLGLDGELDLVKVGEFLARRSRKGLQAGEFLVGRDGFNVVDRDIVEGNQKGEFVNGHVLEHALGVSLKALAERFGRVFICIVAHEGNVRSRDRLGEFARLANVLADVLVVAHEDFDTGVFGFLFHLFELLDGGRPGFFEVDALGSVGNGFGQETRIVGGASADQGETGCSRGRQITESQGEFDTVLGLPFGLLIGKLLTRFRIFASTQEPRLNDVIQRRRGASGVMTEKRASRADTI